jgi:Protein of unknown function (DUF2808)
MKEDLSRISMKKSINKALKKNLNACLICLGLAIAAPLGLVLEPLSAQNNIVIFGPNQGSTLSYVLRTNRPGASSNRISFSAKLPTSTAVAEIQILYPEGFGGIFNPENISIINRRTDKTLEIERAIIDPEIRTVRFVFKQPIEGFIGQEIEINAQGVTNPSRSGMYRIEAQALGTEANPLFQYLGQWLVTIY